MHYFCKSLVEKLNESSIKKIRSGLIVLIHIGKRIKEVFDTGPKDHTVAWLAERLCCDKRNVYRIFNRDNIDIQQLDRLGKILDHNFFVDLVEGEGGGS